MKQIVYVGAFAFFGLLMQFFIRLCIEALLAGNLETFVSWQRWWAKHQNISWLLAFIGLALGFFLGQYFWRRLYVLKLYRRDLKEHF